MEATINVAGATDPNAGKTSPTQSGVIRNVIFAKPNFKIAELPDGTYYDLAFEVELEKEKGKIAEVRLEMSNRMCQGKLAGRTQGQVSFDTLRSLGYDEARCRTYDPTAVAQLVGKTCSVYSKINQKGYENWYFSSGSRKAEPLENAQQIVAAVMQQMAAGNSFTPTQVQPAPVAQPFATAPASNPF